MTAHAAALGAVIGAWLAIPVPVAIVGAAGATAVRLRSPAAVAVAALLLAGLLGHRAHTGLARPTEQSIHGWVTVLDDPRPLARSGVVVTVRWNDIRLEATAFGTLAGRLDDRAAGERMLIDGTVRPTESAWLRWRHVVGRLSVEQIHSHADAPAVFSTANWIRDRLASGARALAPDRRSIFTGMVYGDDRHQSPATADAFRAAGLGHLLVVSGQNVAFVLALAAPVTSRFRPAGRLIAVVVVLAFFALLTRFEPSVMRAVTMAGLGVVAAVAGRPEDGRRVLSVAVAILVLIDPFLIRAAAFQLSVAATAGILWITPPIAERLPGPQPFRMAVATTVGAQVAVTPMLLVLFGEVPLASLPANLLAGPASAPVLMWGLTGGLVAGLVGGTVADVLHWPTGALLWWVDSVARAAATAPPLTLGPRSGAVVVTGVAAIACGGRAGSRRMALAAIVVVVAVGALRVPAPPDGWSRLDGGELWSSAGVTVLVLDQPASGQRLLESLRTGGTGRPDLVIATRGGASDASAVVALVDRFGPVPVLAPPLHRVPSARTAVRGQVVRVADTEVEVVAVTPRLEVSIRSTRPP